MLDDVERRLLRALQNEPGAPVAHLAEQARVPQATAARRFDKLVEDGTIQGQTMRINWAALGYAVEVSLRVTLDKTAPRAFDDFIEAARTVPEVLEIQTFLGRVDVRLSVIARDMAHYQTLYKDHLLALPHIADIEALMHVATIKSDESLPI